MLKLLLLLSRVVGVPLHGRPHLQLLLLLLLELVLLVQVLRRLTTMLVGGQLRHVHLLVRLLLLLLLLLLLRLLLKPLLLLLREQHCVHAVDANSACGGGVDQRVLSRLHQSSAVVQAVV